MNVFKKALAPIDRGLERIRLWAQSFNPYVPEELARDGMQPVPIDESEVRQQASKLVFVVFIIFLIWSVTAPIDSGAVVPGAVVVLGSRKAVQHPAGGVVEEILVKEGQQVAQGDVLLRINPLNIDANLRQAEYEYINAAAAYSRLLAERTEKNTIEWDPELQLSSQPDQVKEATTLQTALFNSRRAELRGQQAILTQQSHGIQQQIKTQESVLQMRLTQLKPLIEDAQSVRKLANDGYVPRARANEAERGGSEAEVSIANLRSEIASQKTAFSANQLEQSKLKAAFNKDVDQQLTEAQKQRETLRAKVDSLRFDQSLSKLKAPVSGTVVGLKVHTEGGVISSGQILMEIVPKDQSLIAEAAVPPHLIDKVRVGMTADMRFSAFNSITTPVVTGTVKLVGADKLPPQPPQFPTEYFLIQVETTAQAQQQLANEKIVPGMPVEVIVKGGERTFMSYLLKPLTDRFARSFKE